jgi:hypothetical protein
MVPIVREEAPPEQLRDPGGDPWTQAAAPTATRRKEGHGESPDRVPLYTPTPGETRAL